MTTGLGQESINTIAGNCLRVGSFDISHTAAELSQLAGVLAGFAFFAVIFVLTNHGNRPPNEGGSARFDYALLALFCATFGLAITAVQYAMLAGEINIGLWYGRASSEEVMADISLSLSILILAAAMILLMPQFDRAEKALRGLTAVVGPPMAVYFVAETCRELTVGIWASKAGRLLCGSNAAYTQVQLWGHTIAPLAVLLCAFSIWVVHRYLPLENKLKKVANRIHIAVPITALVVVIASVSVGVGFDVFQPKEHLGVTGIWIALGVTALITLLQAFEILFYSEDAAVSAASESS